MNYLCIVFVAGIAKINTESIQSKINSYFNDDVVKTFQRKWNMYSVSYKNAIAKCLREDFGYQTMNVYINRYQSHLLISTGYYHTDNQVKLSIIRSAPCHKYLALSSDLQNFMHHAYKISAQSVTGNWIKYNLQDLSTGKHRNSVFKNMVLDSMPNLHDIDINFSLANNVLLVDASISRMILHTSYILFRNVSDIILEPSKQDSYKSSPFRFQQVRNLGDLAITIEGCSFSGIILATLSGNTVNLGHNEMRMKDCQYSIEIYKDGSGTPPVIANYLPKGEEGLNLEILLTRSLLEELVPKLQGAMFSEVNTSAIFTTDLPKIRAKQELLFDETKNWFDELVRGLNKKSLENNMGTIELEDFTISWDDTFEEMPTVKSVKLTKMTLMGLDTVYASHTGGPIRLSEIEITEQLRFNTLQVVGQVSIEGLKGFNEFAVEITDLAVDITLDATNQMKLEVVGWRFLEFSCPNLEFLPTESLVVGYLLHELPKHIKAHLNSVYSGAKKTLFNIDYIDEQPIDGASLGDTNEMLEPQETNLDKKKPNAVQLSDHPELSEKEKREVKLHDVQKTPTDNEQNNSEKTISQLNGAQADENVEVTVVSPKEGAGTVQIKHVDFVENDGIDQKQARIKMPHRNMKRKSLNKPINVHKPAKRIKIARNNRRTNKLSASPSKSIHISDNEIP